jgi:hypothetical protein
LLGTSWSCPFALEHPTQNKPVEHANFTVVSPDSHCLEATAPCTWVENAFNPSSPASATSLELLPSHALWKARVILLWQVLLTTSPTSGVASLRWNLPNLSSANLCYLPGAAVPSTFPSPDLQPTTDHHIQASSREESWAYVPRPERNWEQTHQESHSQALRGRDWRKTHAVLTESSYYIVFFL